MENATKALLIAGAILITITIISLGVALFTQMQQPANNIVNSMTQQEIDQFNSKIAPYLGEKISGSQVNALIQYIFSLNNNDQTPDVTITFPEGEDNSNIITLNTDAEFKKGSNTSSIKKVKTGTFYKVNANYSGSIITSVDVRH